MVVSMAAYGWVGKNPTVEMGDSLFNLLTKWLNTGKGASRELRKLFYGSITWLPWVVTQRRWSRMYRRDRSGLRWNSKPYTSLRLLQQSLSKLGFTSDEPWIWKPLPDFRPVFTGDESKLDLHPLSQQPVELQLHIIRRMCKFQCYLKFSKQLHRRDAADLHDTLDLPDRVQSFAEVDLTAARTALENSGSCRALFMCGLDSASFLSPAARFFGCGLEEIHQCEDACPFCVQEPGSHDHIFWNCSQNVAPVPAPVNWLQRRFGWPILGNANNLNIIQHLTRTVEEPWSLRHPS